MALEPQIALGVTAPVIQDPIEAQAKIESVKALADQRQALAEQRQQQAQALIAKAKSQAGINAALKFSNGDLRGAADYLTQNDMGIEGQQLRDQQTENTAKLAAATEATTKSHAAQIDLAAKILGSIDPNQPEQYAAGLKAFKATLDPSDAQAISQIAPDNPNPQDIPGIVDRLNRMQVGAKALFDQHEKYVSGFLEGKYTSNLAGVLAITPVQDRPAALKMLTAQVPDYQTAMALQQQFLPLLNAKPEDIWQAGMTPEQRASNADKAADNARQTAIAAETARHDRAMEARPVAGAVTLGPQAGQSDTVQGYIQDMLTGTKKLSDVPAAGGTRNAVVAELHKEGYDISKPLTAQTQARVEFANGVMPQVQQVADLAKKINDAGLMGTVGGRFRALASGESSAADLQGLTPEQRKLVGEFTTKSGLLVSGVAMVHGGARGGGSTQLLEQLKPMLDPHNKDIDTYLGNLSAARDILQGYADMGGKAKSSTPAPDYVWDPVAKKLVKKGGG
jgi:hypothetical protein